jgi:ribosomal protein S12 methylthiotransferase
MKDAESLVNSGVKELIIISQDTSAYGLDINYKEGTWRNETYKSNLFDLTQALSKLGVWVRMQYVYPYPHVDKIIQNMADGGILPYIDVPFQHASPSVLKRMKRPANQHKLMERIKSWRKICPNITIRSSFIVGFPGETEEDFEILINFLKEAKLGRVGAFKYENVDGAQAFEFENQIPQNIIDERYERLMETQQEISFEIMNAKIGETHDVIIDEVDEDGAFGRSMADAPEIDGCVFLNGDTEVKAGDIVSVKIKHTDEYDMWGIRE